jgi:hypothetical protein
MSNRFVQQPPDGSLTGLWGVPEADINALGRGVCSGYLYDDAGALKLSKGMIGLDDGSQRGAVIIDTVITLSLIGLTASCWARVEASRTGTVPAVTITSIAGATDPAALPAGFTGVYDGDKQGYYVTASKRIVGLAWINAAGVLEGVINCLSGSDYAGYSTSDDAYDTIYNFNRQKYSLPFIPERKIYEQSAAFTAGAYYQYQAHMVTNAANSFNATIPAAGVSRVGQRIRVEKVDTGAGITTVTRTGADTFGSTGATAFPLRLQGDRIELECVKAGAGYGWKCIDSLATIDSAALAVSTAQSLAHGCGVRPRINKSTPICLSAELNFSVGDELDVFPNEVVSHNAITISRDATNIKILPDTNALIFQDKSTTTAAAITMAKWGIRNRYSL